MAARGSQVYRRTVRRYANNCLRCRTMRSASDELRFRYTCSGKQRHPLLWDPSDTEDLSVANSRTHIPGYVRARVCSSAVHRIHVGCFPKYKIRESWGVSRASI